MHRRAMAGRSRLRLFHLSIACLTAAACSAALASSAQADVTEVTGGAYGESVDVTLLGGLVPITTTSGPEPAVSMSATEGGPAGDLGPFTASTASVSVGTGLLSTGILNASTEGGNLEGDDHSGFATSSASVNEVSAAAGRITATTVGSTCTSNGDGSSGTSTLETAEVLGVAVALNPAPNTTIPLPGVGRVILNEQIRPTNGPGDTSIIVRAIHVELDGILGDGDIIIAESRCGAKGPDVVPVAPIGLLGVTALLGLGFAGMQWKKRRDHPSVAASTH